MKYVCLFGLLFATNALAAITFPINSPSSANPLLPVHQIETLNIHDPAILVDTISQTYYVYDSFHFGDPNEKMASLNQRAGVEVYWSKDLQHWHGPKLAYEIEADSWAQSEHAPWAPEVSVYRDKYYMFLTLHNFNHLIRKDENRPPMIKRGSQILVSDSPMGPFKRISNMPHTPEDEMALDGTLWIEDGQAWMIYCQEWIQLGSGLIKAIRLNDDFSGTVGEPITLFSADEVDWTAKTTLFDGQRIKAVVTDGPWPYRSKSGELLLLWSSWNIDKTKAYTTSLAISSNGKLDGHWRHREVPLIDGDRGHGNIFRTFDGTLMMALHRYFKQPHTRLQIFEIEDLGDDLNIKTQRYGHK